MKLGGGETAVINSVVFKDNNLALSTANYINITPRKKQISLKYHFFEYHCGKGSGITLVKFGTLLKKEDIFTKVIAQ